MCVRIQNKHDHTVDHLALAIKEIDLAQRADSLMVQDAFIADKEAEGCKRIAAMLRHDNPKEFLDFERGCTWRAIRLRERKLPVDLKSALAFEAGRLFQQYGAIADLDARGSMRFYTWVIGEELARINAIDAAKAAPTADE